MGIGYRDENGIGMDGVWGWGRKMGYGDGIGR